MKKEWHKSKGAIAIFIILGLAFIGSLLPENSENDVPSDGMSYISDESSFNILAMQSLYDNGFCYEGMLEEEGKECGEVEYPFIRVYNAEDFTEAGKILLVTQVTEDLYEELPDLYDKTINYIFRNVNQESVDRIYVKNNEWSR